MSRNGKKYGIIAIVVAVLVVLVALILLRPASDDAASSQQSKPLASSGADALEQPQAITIVEKEKEILPKFVDLYAQNNEMVGWIEIEGTVLDYPIMHTPDDPQKYLYKDFDGNYYKPGSIFLDYRCTLDPGSDNLILYGHNMRNGSMFREIMNYKSESYWREHPTITLSTLYEEREYEVLAAFYDQIYYVTDTCFKFYNFVDAVDAADYGNAITYYRQKALYDTGVTAQYGDQLITLVTCAYHVEDGRFVVVAKRS